MQPATPNVGNNHVLLNSVLECTISDCSKHYSGRERSVDGSPRQRCRDVAQELPARTNRDMIILRIRNANAKSLEPRPSEHVLWFEKPVECMMYVTIQTRTLPPLNSAMAARGYNMFVQHQAQRPSPTSPFRPSSRTPRCCAHEANFSNLLQSVSPRQAHYICNDQFRATNRIRR